MTISGFGLLGGFLPVLSYAVLALVAGIGSTIAAEARDFRAADIKVESFSSNRGAHSSARDTYGLWGRPALRDPRRPSAADWLELVCLAQGKVILAASTFRREKMRWDLCRGTVDDCPVSVQFKQSAAVDGPQETGATGTVERAACAPR